MLKQKYFLTDFFILSAEKQPIKLSWRNIEWLRYSQNRNTDIKMEFTYWDKYSINKLILSGYRGKVSVVTKQ